MRSRKSVMAPVSIGVHDGQSEYLAWRVGDVTLTGVAARRVARIANPEYRTNAVIMNRAMAEEMPLNAAALAVAKRLGTGDYVAKMLKIEAKGKQDEANLKNYAALTAALKGLL